MIMLDGRPEITVFGEVHEVGSREAILLPGVEPRSMGAPAPFVTSLVMLEKANPSTSEQS